MKPLPLLFLLIIVLYLVFILLLIAFGKRTAARAIGGFIPDCIVLFKNLIHDQRVARRHKFMLGALVAYLVMPIDIIPDFIPIAGQLDDAILVTLVLRTLLKSAGTQIVKDNWRGPTRTIKVLFKMARLPYE